MCCLHVSRVLSESRRSRFQSQRKECIKLKPNNTFLSLQYIFQSLSFFELINFLPLLIKKNVRCYFFISLPSFILFHFLIFPFFHFSSYSSIFINSINKKYMRYYFIHLFPSFLFVHFLYFPCFFFFLLIIFYYLD